MCDSCFYNWNLKSEIPPHLMSIPHPMIQEHTHDRRNIFTPTRMIGFSPAPQNKRHGVAVNFLSPRQKLGIPAIKRHNANKILQKLKNNPIFILLLQNKGVTLQCCSGQQNNNH